MNSTVDDSDTSEAYGVYNQVGQLRVSNSMIYDVANVSTSSNTGVWGFRSKVGTTSYSYLHNVTIADISDNGGPAAGSGAFGVENNGDLCVVRNSFVGDIRGISSPEATFNGTITQSYNVSSDGLASGTGSVTGKDQYEAYFVNFDIAGYAMDLHLKNSGLVLWGTDGTDLSADADLPVTMDIDRTTRSSTPDIGADEFEGGVAVYYSVGTSTADLDNGGNVTISEGLASFTVAQPDNVGVGDELVADSKTYYISGRVSSTRYSVTTRTGATPADLGSSAVTSIQRAFNSISDAESDSTDATHLGAANLRSAAANVVLNWALYKDGVFNGWDGSGSALSVAGYSTDSLHYVRMFAPAETSEVGASQRHTGTADTGVVIRPVNNVGGISFFFLSADIGHLRVEGLELDLSSLSNVGYVEVFSAPAANRDGDSELHLDSCLIHDLTNSTRDDGDNSNIRGVNTTEGKVFIENNVFYNLNNISSHGSSNIKAISISESSSATDDTFIYNNTLYNIKNSVSAGYAYGISVTTQSGPVTIENNYVGNVDSTNGSESDYSLFYSPTEAYNVSSDDSVSGTGSVTGQTAYSTYFWSVTNGSEDLHLRNTSLSLWGTDGTDLSRDTGLAVTADIDGEARDHSAPDIGADEYNAVYNPTAAVYYSVGTSTADLDNGGNVTISSGVASFTADQPDNVGVGDKLVAGGNTYYISGRSSSTIYRVRTRTGATPANLTSSAVTSITRAFNTIAAAETNSTDATHLGTANLRAAGAGVILNWALYKDGVFNGADGGGGILSIDGYSTDSTHYIRMFAPRDSDEVGVSQRHTGTAGTGVVIRPTTSTNGADFYRIIEIYTNHLRFDGLEIDGSLITNAGDLVGVLASTQTRDDSGEFYLDNCLVHDLTNTTRGEASRSQTHMINVFEGKSFFRNNMLYNMKNVSTHGDSDAAAIHLGTSSGAADAAYIFNNTIFNVKNLGSTNAANGVYENTASGPLTIKNTYIGNVDSTNGSEAAYEYTYQTPTVAYNISSDDTATGTGAVTGKNLYDRYFVNSGTTATDLHLKNSGLVLWGTDGTDLSADADFPVTEDIDGSTRSSTPDIGADEFEGGVAVYYSVGTSTADLDNGGNVTITSEIASFDTAQPDNVGVGDELVAGGNTYYLSGRVSSTRYSVTTRTGATPADLTSSAVTSIQRAFNTLADIETNSTDASHLGTAILTAAGAGVQLNWALYKDDIFDGSDGAGELWTIDGYSTDSVHYLRAFVPEQSSEVGTSQRHTGIAGSGVVIQPNKTTTDTAGLITVNDDYVRFEGIEIDGSSYMGEKIYGLYTNQVNDTSSDIRVDRCLIHDLSNSTRLGFTWAVNHYTGRLRLSNTIIYDITNNSTGSTARAHGISIAGPTNPAYIYNNTVFNIKSPGGGLGASGIYSSGSTTPVLKNNFVGNTQSNNFSGTMTQSYNVSSDATATGTGSVTGKDLYALYFVNSGTTATDLHLRGSSLNLWGTNGTDLSWDTGLPVTTDIDGEARAAAPDIGADEFSGGAAVYYSVGTSTADLDNGGNVTISKGVASFTVDQPDNVGVGDELVAGGNTYYITGRASATKYLVSTRTGYLPADLGSNAVTSIQRAFNAISDAETNSTDSSHLDTAVLHAGGADAQLHWALYNDGDFDGGDGAGGEIVILGYSTDSSHYVRIYAPKDASEVGTSQRHTGAAGTGVVIKPDLSVGGDSHYRLLETQINHLRIEGIDFDASSISGMMTGSFIGVEDELADEGAEIYIDSCLIHDMVNTTRSNSAMAGINVKDGRLFITNNIVYNMENVATHDDDSNIEAIVLAMETDDSFVYNNTVYNIKNSGSASYAVGILDSNSVGATATIKNNYVGDVDSTNGPELAFSSSNSPVLASNVSFDDTATGTGSVTGQTAYSDYFYDSGSTATDLRLRHDDNQLWGTDGADLSGDANLPVRFDIEGEARSDFDIGADEVTNETADAPTTPYCEGDPTPVADVADTTPEFSAVCDDADGDACTYYEIDVDTQSDFAGTSKWASGKTAQTSCTEGTRCEDASYAGAALATDGSTYYWRIRFWDAAHDGGAGEADVPGDWSATQTFTMLAAANTPPNAPQTPYCEGQTNPASVSDPTPEFSAIYDDDETGDTAEYYEIDVDTGTDFSGGGDMWASGKLALGSSLSEDTRMPAVSYAGTALDPATTYYWRIRFWDDTDDTGTWSDTQNFTTAAGDVLGAGNAVYYSVGTSTADLDNGGNVSITDGLAAFTVAQPDNVGVGDELVADSKTYYIAGRVSNTLYTVTTRTGANPANLTSSAVTSINRAFNAISTAETNSTDATHLGTAVLPAAGADVQLNWALYNDGSFNGETARAGVFPLKDIRPIPRIICACSPRWPPLRSV